MASNTDDDLLFNSLLLLHHFQKIEDVFNQSKDCTYKILPPPVSKLNKVVCFLVGMTGLMDASGNILHFIACWGERKAKTTKMSGFLVSRKLGDTDSLLELMYT